MKKYFVLFFSFVLFSGLCSQCLNRDEAPEGFEVLFNGTDFSNWLLPVGDKGHWTVMDGVIDYDAESEAEDKNLWSEKEYEDFILYVDWRIKDTPWENSRVPLIKSDGSHKKNAKGEDIKLKVPDSDSGIYLRGSAKAQVNIWCWPIGSGEVYGYRMDGRMPAEVRKGVTPMMNADNDIGEWNTFKITLKDDRLTVDLNGFRVLDNALLPGIPEKGRLALQHHGSKRNGEWISPPSLVQFRNIFIKEL